MGSDLLTITDGQKTGFKEVIKDLLGRFAVGLCPQKAVHLYRRPVACPNGIRDKAILFHLRNRSKNEKRHRFFERLHRDFWSGTEGAVFAKNCDHRFEDLFLAKQKLDFDALTEIWNAGKTNKIVEFGCNSGLLLNYLTTHLKGVESSVGIEINEDQVKWNQEFGNFDHRIQFECRDAWNWLRPLGSPATLFVTNGGVLEYFRRKRLDQMLSHISRKLEPAIFFAVEPVAADHDLASETNSIPFGNELSFSHNYTNLFETNGFKIVHQRNVQFESWNMLTTIAVTDSSKLPR